jgi:hypothetical protein
LPSIKGALTQPIFLCNFASKDKSSEVNSMKSSQVESSQVKSNQVRSSETRPN